MATEFEQSVTIENDSQRRLYASVTWYQRGVYGLHFGIEGATMNVYLERRDRDAVRRLLDAADKDEDERAHLREQVTA